VRRTIVVMGVAGCGKTTVGAALAHRLGMHFVDGDDLHPSTNVEKMRSGSPLTDDDRWPWLDAVGTVLVNASMHADGVVVACSALRQRYRDRIRAASPGVRFVLLVLPSSVASARLAARDGHFMPATLIASQFATLELPTADEADITVQNAEHPLAEIVDFVVAAVRADH
jgi:gluconokinase